MNGLRFTVRFRADLDDECRAAEYLKSLKHGDQNRFLVEAVLSVLKSGTAASPDCLRQIIREELAAALSTAVIAMPAAVEQGANISAAEQMQDDQAILDDLELFG